MVFLMILGCDSGGTQPFSGTKMSDYFTFDGSRTYTYNNLDVETIDWQLIVEKKATTSVVDEREVVTMEYLNGNTAELLGSVQWSSKASDAVLVHGYSLGATGALVEFDPPVAITDDDDAMRLDDVIEADATGSDGSSYHFTTTFVEALSECPSTAQDDFAKCVRLTIDEGDGDNMTGPLFTGDFTFVASWGAVFQTIPGWATAWELTDIEYVAEGDE